MVVLTNIPASTMSSLATTAITVAPCGNRQLIPHGDNDEQRICRSPASDQTASGRSFGREPVSYPGALAGLVPPLVAPLSSDWPQRTIRPHVRQRPTQANRARARTHDFDRSPTADLADPSRHALQSHWGQCHFSRAASLAYSTVAQSAHGRTRVATQWCDVAPRAPGPLLTSPHLPGVGSARVQPTPSSGWRRPHLSQRQPTPVLHLRWPRRLRRRRLPETLPFPQDGRHSRLPGRMLEEPRSARPSAIRQRPRSRRLGASRALSLASPAVVFALRHRTRVDPTRPTLPQRA